MRMTGCPLPVIVMCFAAGKVQRIKARPLRLARAMIVRALLARMRVATIVMTVIALSALAPTRMNVDVGRAAMIMSVIVGGSCPTPFRRNRGLKSGHRVVPAILCSRSQ